MSNSPPPNRTAIRSELESLTLGAFSVTHETTGDRVVVRLNGNADSKVAKAFERYLERLHDLAVGAKLRVVVLDFRELYFLTSSCIKCLTDFIRRDMATEPASQYRIRLLTTPALRWQEKSFDVLCQLAPLLVTAATE
jgi:hypothetical protein